MKREHWAAIANFFLPGVGYLIGGIKRMLAVLWLIGIIGLTYVEFGIRESEPTLYAVMFASVLVMNAAFAVDAYREVKAADAENAPAQTSTMGGAPQAS